MTVLLLVDDEALILHVINDALVEGGYTIVEAFSGDDAIAALRDESRTFAGLITDVNLGRGVSGWDVARAARESSAEMPVVYMTGDSAHEWPAQGVPNSIIVQKPFALLQIVTAITQLINEAATRRAVVEQPRPSENAAT